MWFKFTLRCFGFFSLLLLVNCGFHLRGQVTLNNHLKTIFLKTANPYGELARNLRETLKSSGSVIATDPKQADIILAIINEQQSNQQTNVSSTQQTRQYTLVSSVSFAILTPENQQLVAPQTINETRTLTTNANTTLADSNEVTTLYQQMHSAIVFDLMSRLASHNMNEQLNNYFKKSKK